MPLGAGLAPAGTSAAGYGVPDTAPITSTEILPDPVTGLSQPGRGFTQTAPGGPLTYSFTADGRIAGMAQVPQLVTLAMKTVLGSAVNSNLGLSTASLQEQGANLAQQVQAVVTAAFAPIVAQKLVTLDSTSVVQLPDNPDRAGILVQWTDLTTNTQRTTIVGNGSIQTQ